MFKNVIVGVDGHERGRDAIALAKRLVEEGGELTLGYVYRGDARVARGSSPPYEAAEHERALELLAMARDEGGIEAALSCTGAPSAGRGLHELAEAAGAELLVVGSSRRGLIGRVLLGDDTSAALNGAPCAIAIAPAGYEAEPGLMREIGVAFNASVESEHAVEVARELALQYGAKLSAMEAVSLPTYAYMGGALGTVLQDLVKQARLRVEGLEGVEAHAVYGQAVEELALYSASLDLLVVGSRGYGPVGRLVHGSTSQRLARLARCPLLVLPRGARAAKAAEASKDDMVAVHA